MSYLKPFRFILPILGLLSSSFFLLYPGLAISNMLDVTPTHLYLSSKEPMGTLKLNNPGNQSSVVQLSLLRWTQIKGVDHYEQTKELLVVPHVFRIAPHTTQLIRVALRSKPDASFERAYRLYLTQVLPKRRPQLKASHKKEGLRVAIRISLPLLVLPTAPIRKSWVWEAQQYKQNQLKLTLKNTGNALLFINRLGVYTQREQIIASQPKTFTYIFPNQQHTWLLKLEHTKAAQKITLKPDVVKAKINQYDTVSRVHRLS